MHTSVLNMIAAMAGSAAICLLLMPLLIRYSAVLKLVDKPGERKLHKQPIPAIGGMVMVLSIALTTAWSPGLQQLMKQYWPLGLALLALMVTGVADDRLSLPAWVRFVVQAGAAWFMAKQGIRLHSLHGIMGVQQLPVWFQYAFTIVLTVGVTNAFNLLDGIDGLAGAMAFTNLCAFGLVAFVAKQVQWLHLILPTCAVLLVFLRFNWRPARVFMGDGGSLVFGFLMAIMGIDLVEQSYVADSSHSPAVIVTIAGALMLPVVDTLRVFYARVARGRSPFSADKNHLHHWLIRHHLLHSQATTRLIIFQAVLLACSLLLVQFCSITVVVLLQAIVVAAYSKLLHLSLQFRRWLVFIKRLETAP